MVEKPVVKGKIQVDLKPLTAEQQYEAIAEEMYEAAKEDIVTQIRKALEEGGGRITDRIRAGWSRG